MYGNTWVQERSLFSFVLFLKKQAKFAIMPSQCLPTSLLTRVVHLRQVTDSSVHSQQIEEKNGVEIFESLLDRPSTKQQALLGLANLCQNGTKSGKLADSGRTFQGAQALPIIYRVTSFNRHNDFCY